MSGLSVCRPCQRRLISVRPTRPFTTTTRKSALPPESPDYVYVPQSLQPEIRLSKFTRGRLPVPREVFPERKREKMDPDFAVRATPTSKRAYDPKTATPEQKEKHKIAQLRKAHLREGLEELRNRKIQSERRIARRSQFKKEERARLIEQEEREDERLMNTSVLKSMLPTKGQQLPDPDAQRRRRRARTQLAPPAKEIEARRNALHTLYMNARSFIVDETALDEEIAEVFPDERDPAFESSSTLVGTNIWDTGVPPTVSDMLKKTNALGQISRTRTVHGEANNEVSRISAERVKRIAEEMSGGKL